MMSLELLKCCYYKCWGSLLCLKAQAAAAVAAAAAHVFLCC